MTDDPGGAVKAPRMRRGRPRRAGGEKGSDRTAAAIAALVPDAFPGDAHALLMLVYKDPRNDLKLRLDAAKLAIRFEKQELSPERRDGEAEAPAVAISAEPLTEEEWHRAYGRDLASPDGATEGPDRLPPA